MLFQHTNTKGLHISKKWTTASLLQVQLLHLLTQFRRTDIEKMLSQKCNLELLEYYDLVYPYAKFNASTFLHFGLII